MTAVGNGVGDAALAQLTNYRWVRVADVAAWCAANSVPFYYTRAQIPVSLQNVEMVKVDYETGGGIADAFPPGEAIGVTSAPFQANWPFWAHDPDGAWALVPDRCRLQSWDACQGLSQDRLLAAEGQRYRNSLADTAREGRARWRAGRLRWARFAVGAFAIEGRLGLVRVFGEEFHKELVGFASLPTRRFKETAQDAVVD